MFPVSVVASDIRTGAILPILFCRLKFRLLIVAFLDTYLAKFLTISSAQYTPWVLVGPLVKSMKGLSDHARLPVIQVAVNELSNWAVRLRSVFCVPEQADVLIRGAESFRLTKRGLYLTFH